MLFVCLMGYVKCGSNLTMKIMVRVELLLILCGRMNNRMDGWMECLIKFNELG